MFSPPHNALHLYIKLKMGAPTFGYEMQLQAIQRQQGMKDKRKKKHTVSLRVCVRAAVRACGCTSLCPWESDCCLAWPPVHSSKRLWNQELNASASRSHSASNVCLPCNCLFIGLHSEAIVWRSLHARRQRGCITMSVAIQCKRGKVINVNNRRDIFHK